MAKKKVIWTSTATNKFNRIIDYMQQKWSDREIEKFVEMTDVVIQYISEKPLMFRKTNKKNVREALITEHNLLIYKIYSDHISLITFWDTRQNPKRKKKIK
jgi:plasmid stabilization system protein ParE